MSSITTDKGILHYEVIGRGKPVIFLHGWLSSWQLWQHSMTCLSANYRTYALDFWGFGESGKKLDSYDLPDFVELVSQFMDQMGIESAPLIGHSMGGTVSLITGLTHAERVSKIMVIGSPLNGKSLSFLLKMSGRKPVASFLYANINAFRWTMKYYARHLSQDPNLPAMMDADITNTTLNSFLTSIASLRKTDLTGKLAPLKMPVMGLYGQKDNVVSPRQSRVLRTQLPAAHIVDFPACGHFIMLDQPQAFNETVLTFLNGKQNLTSMD